MHVIDTTTLTAYRLEDMIFNGRSIDEVRAEKQKENKHFEVSLQRAPW